MQNYVQCEPGVPKEQEKNGQCLVKLIHEYKMVLISLLEYLAEIEPTNT